MMPRPIQCAADLADGTKCDQSATVTKIHYVYDRQPVGGEPDGYNLNEIHYSVVCPNCGQRTLIEKPTAS